MEGGFEACCFCDRSQCPENAASVGASMQPAIMVDGLQLSRAPLATASLQGHVSRVLGCRYVGLPRVSLILAFEEHWVTRQEHETPRCRASCNAVPMGARMRTGVLCCSGTMQGRPCNCLMLSLENPMTSWGQQDHLGGCLFVPMQPRFGNLNAEKPLYEHTKKYS